MNRACLRARPALPSLCQAGMLLSLCPRSAPSIARANRLIVSIFYPTSSLSLFFILAHVRHVFSFAPLLSLLPSTRRRLFPTCSLLPLFSSGALFPVAVFWRFFLHRCRICLYFARLSSRCALCPTAPATPLRSLSLLPLLLSSGSPPPAIFSLSCRVAFSSLFPLPSRQISIAFFIALVALSRVHMASSPLELLPPHLPLPRPTLIRLCPFPSIDSLQCMSSLRPLPPFSTFVGDSSLFYLFLASGIPRQPIATATMPLCSFLSRV